MVKPIIEKISVFQTYTLLKLAFPLIITGLVEASIGFFSTLFLAHLGTKDLAAGALVSWLFVTIMVILWGTLTSVSVLVAQRHGKKDVIGVTSILRDGLLLSILLTLPTFILLWYTAPILLLVGQDPEVVILANTYLHALAWGLLPDFITLVFLQFIIGLGHTRTSLFFTIIWVPIAISAIYLLMFGKLGLPALGIAGIGWGMTVSYWIVAISLLFYCYFTTEYNNYFDNILSFATPSYMKEILIVGMPMGAMYSIEIGFFLAVTLIMGKIGGYSLAANQIVFQYLNQMMAIVFSLAQAISVYMGHNIGAKNYKVAEQIAYSGLLISFVLLFIVALIYWFFPTYLIAIDINIHARENISIVKLATSFLFIAAFFQVFEGLRVALYGALRSFKDTRFTLLISIFSFWIIALPLGCFFSFVLHWQGEGIWWAMVVGAVISTIILFLRFQHKISRAQRLYQY